MMRRVFLFLTYLQVTALAHGADQPNILWLTAEDMGPHLGCYGDSYATTPELGAFAKRSLVYRNAWSNAPVCAPARTTIITGLYPPSMGAESMRCLVRLPDEIKLYPLPMRAAGYYCVNPGKEDYNVEKVGPVWDKIDKGDPWPQLKSRQPFMAVFNNTGTHESQIRKRPHTWIHDPAKAPIPAYHPDTLEVRQDWAQYYDNITEMDAWFGKQLKQLEANGLADDTIVFFYGDHGSGMPRGKRWLYQSGLSVPLLVHVPEKFRHLLPQGTAPIGDVNRLVAFVDLAPTVISLAGVEPPSNMQGHAFMGKYAAPPQPYLYGFRGRMDERMDLSRSVRNERYHYIRNYMPHRVNGEHVSYMFETPTTQKWKDLYDAGKLNADQSHFWEPKPPEELYDIQKDPDEIHNLATISDYQETLRDLRQAHVDHVMEIRDLGFLPEAELFTRAPQLSPYELGHDSKLYPLAEIFKMAHLASLLIPESAPDLATGLVQKDSAVRYWAALGLLALGKPAVAAGHEQLLEAMLNDPSPSVRTVAAEALAQYGFLEDEAPALAWLIEAADGSKHGLYVAVQALDAIDHLGRKALPLKEQISQLPTKGDWLPPRGGDYVPRLVKKIQRNLD